jgi:hypothetical protein
MTDPEQAGRDAMAPLEPEGLCTECGRVLDGPGPVCPVCQVADEWWDKVYGGGS